MKKDKNEKLKEVIDSLKNELDTIKNETSDVNSDDVDLLLQQINDVISGNFRVSKFRLILHFFKFLLVGLLIDIFLVLVIFGFSTSLLNQISPISYLIIIPGVALVYYLTLRVLNLIISRLFGGSVFALISSCLIFSVIYAVIDEKILHICTSFDKSLLLSTILMIFVIILDIIYASQRLFKISLKGRIK